MYTVGRQESKLPAPGGTLGPIPNSYALGELRGGRDNVATVGQEHGPLHPAILVGERSCTVNRLIDDVGVEEHGLQHIAGKIQAPACNVRVMQAIHCAAGQTSLSHTFSQPPGQVYVLQATSATRSHGCV